MWTKKAYQLMFLLLIECVSFFLFAVFMQTEKTWKVGALVLGVIALGILLMRWEGVRNGIGKIYRENKFTANVGFILMVLAIPFVFQKSPYLIHIFLISGLFAILALGLNFQLGSTNVVSFATAASYGIGAYTSALLAIHYHVPWWLGILIGGGVASFFGFVLGFSCMKAKDYYLSLVTIAFGMIIYLLLNNLTWTGGPNGIPNIPPLSLAGHSFQDPLVFFGMKLPPQSNYFYFVFFLVLLALIVAHRLHHSRTGLTWNAIREDEIAARCQGIDVTRYKILAFCIDAFFGGVTGAIYAHYIGFISPDNFHFVVSIVVVTMVVFGGMDNVLGVVFGAIVLTILPEKFRVFQDFRLLVYALIVIVMLIFRPQGLFPQKLRAYKK
jgi:ABC-type branched-subunit amino acid transport system permease subunit